MYDYNNFLKLPLRGKDLHVTSPSSLDYGLFRDRDFCVLCVYVLLVLYCTKAGERGTDACMWENLTMNVGFLIPIMLGGLHS